MATAEPLLPGPGAAQKEVKHTNFSIFYGANEYLETLSKKYEEYDELADLLKSSPDGGADADAYPAKKGEEGSNEPKKKMLSLDVDDDKRSKRTKRSVPTPNVPEPMPSNLAFMFAKITLEQKLYMWNIYTLIFATQALSIVAYWALLKFELLPFWLSTIIMGTIIASLGIQNVYILHDVIHGATFPPYEWQAYITHPFADFISLPWMEMIMEHNRHHNSTFDLLNHGEFGWDPANWLYVLQEWTPAWYGWLTVPLVPLWHFVGASDTGGLFAILWWMNFPDAGPSGKCDKAFWTKWLPARVKHNLFVLSCWACVWLLGSVGLGLPLAEGWKFTFIVSAMFRTGFSIAWTFFTNLNHSHWWNEFLATDPARAWPVLHEVMAICLGGSHRWNEMLFHDIHHMCPGRIGAMSQRGRFHGWQKVHDACVEILANGLWKHNDPETQMEQHQKRRSFVLKSRKESKQSKESQ